MAGKDIARVGAPRTIWELKYVCRFLFVVASLAHRIARAIFAFQTSAICKIASTESIASVVKDPSVYIFE